MAIFDVSLYEPIYPPWTADSIAVSADSVVNTADGAPLTPATEVNDAVINANFVSAEIFEPVASIWTADSTAVTADSTYWTADGGPLEGARDIADAEVIPAIIVVPSGGYVPARAPKRWVYGYGYGVLPELEGEAIGTVSAAGHSAAHILVRAAGIGQHGQVGAAIGVFKDLSIASKGAAGTCGAGAGVIAIKLNAIATGRHDDDEAAVITFLLAAA